MHPAIGVLLCCGAASAYPPRPLDLAWSPFAHFGEPQEGYEYVGPSMVGAMVVPRHARNPSPGAFHIVTNAAAAGVNFLDNRVPPVYESAVRPIDPRVLDELKNFRRPRRQENDTTLPTPAEVESTPPTTMTPTTELLTIVTPMATPALTSQTVMQSKMDVVAQRPDTSQLQLIVKQLNDALLHIQEHGDERVHEEITNATSTEKLIQYISSQFEVLSKNKQREGRAQRIKQVSEALEILLGRIATSAKPFIPLKPTESIGADRGKPDPALIAKIVQHMAALKKSAIFDKVNDGYELTSAELDGGLRPVRQGVESGGNTIDVNQDGADDDGERDAEVVPARRSTTTVRPTEVTARQEETSDQQSSSQEGGGNLVANLLASLLGSLSKPDGGVDVDAIVALIGGLSVQRDDGTFDFSGITDLLQSFLGGDGDEGGSDVGAFLGGLLGAVIQGSANPPGPKGTGRLTGNLIANILPGLSGPPPPSSSEDANNNGKHQAKPIDSGSFLAGLLSSMLASSSGSSSGSGGMGADNNNHKMGSASFFVKIKQELFKAIFHLVTSILGASSGGISHASGASSHASAAKGGKH